MKVETPTQALSWARQNWLLGPKHTVPRLELCAAVLAVELADLISSELDMQIDAMTFYTDSKVVLGYICNEPRRFYVCVSNRITHIRSSSHPPQWKYVSTSSKILQTTRPGQSLLPIFQTPHGSLDLLSLIRILKNLQNLTCLSLLIQTRMQKSVLRSPPLTHRPLFNSLDPCTSPSSPHGGL